jgi:hypothetical protein
VPVSCLGWGGVGWGGVGGGGGGGGAQRETRGWIQEYCTTPRTHSGKVVLMTLDAACAPSASYTPAAQHLNHKPSLFNHVHPRLVLDPSTSTRCKQTPSPSAPPPPLRPYPPGGTR